ncbi:MAG: insulinase family protein [Candidatus Delongbacteria bacterium]|jgi:Zn-dependent M16 (insulinase) family peptidase|nr:insulinase family protein [Candidatus Delongbacteria bacterium]
MKEFVVGEIYQGFKLTHKEYIDEISSNVLSFEHTKNKAKLTALKNDDDNKTFAISFKTIPTDSTGVPHILEHCVLSGSEKYPLKDVFAELVKGGLSTFINAFTGSDATYYPYSTRNSKEYFNFMSVYLDTTLRPLLTKHTFYQEGWHYELDKADEPAKIQGIVFNEMKGAMSNPVSVLMDKLAQTLYPGSTYSVNSGGDPESIPDLSYEQFVAFHKTFYHPSNSKIYLYGNADLNEELKFINDNYLDSFDYLEVDSSIDAGDLISSQQFAEFKYPINPSESNENRSYIVLGTKISTPDNIKENIAFNIITNILFNSDASILKKNIMKSGIANDLTGYYDDNAYYTSMVTFISGSDPEKRDQFLEIYYSSLKELVKSKLDPDLVKAEINNIEFKLKEKTANAQRGISYMFSVLNSMLYETDAIKALKIRNILAEIKKEALEDNLFENLIEKYLLNRDLSAVVTLVPDKELNAVKLAKESKRVDDYKNSLTAEQVNELVDFTEKFKVAQETPVSEEDMQKVPKLSLSDIERKSIFRTPEVSEVSGVKVLTNEHYTNDIIYLSLGMKIDSIPVELLPYLNIFTDLFKEIGTTNKDYETLTKEIAANFGGFNCVFNTVTSVDDSDEFTPMMWAEIKTLKEYFPKVKDILIDIIQNISFDDKDRIEEIIKSRLHHRDTNLKSEGYQYALNRISANLNKQGKYIEHVKGLTSYFKYKEVNDNFDSLFDELIEKMKLIKNLMFRKDNLIINITSDKEGIEIVKKDAQDILNVFDTTPVKKIDIEFDEFKPGEAFLTSSDVVFASEGGKFLDDNFKYTGKVEVLKNYLSSDYLFNMIRIQGGAYGAWVSLNSISGIMTMTSYRDPNVKKTYEAYEGISEHISKFQIDNDTFDNIKIGAYSAFDPLQSPNGKGMKARNDYLSGEKKERVEKIIDEILETTQQDIRDTADQLKKFNDNSIKSIIGSAELIKKDADLFSELIEIK